MGVGTAPHRLGRISHLLVPLVLKAHEIVIAPPDTWLGLVVVAEDCPVEWLASAVDSASSRLLTLAIATAVLLGSGIFLLHRQIQRRIDEIGRL